MALGGLLKSALGSVAGAFGGPLGLGLTVAGLGLDYLGARAADKRRDRVLGRFMEPGFLFARNKSFIDAMSGFGAQSFTRASRAAGGPGFSQAAINAGARNLSMGITDSAFRSAQDAEARIAASLAPLMAAPSQQSQFARGVGQYGQLLGFRALENNNPSFLNPYRQTRRSSTAGPGPNELINNVLMES